MYICECGKEFESANSFNGHKSHCKEHLVATGKYEQFIARKAIYLDSLKEASKNKMGKSNKIAYEFICEKCGKSYVKLMTPAARAKVHHFFCSRACANSHSKTADTISKISSSLTVRASAPTDLQILARQKRIDKMEIAKQKYLQAPKYCKYCNSVLPYELRFRATCSAECFKYSLHLAGSVSANKQGDTKRSFGEIAFYNKCSEYFNNVEYNKPMFNNWDADIILPDLKIAILYNGPWHYKEISKKCSLAKIQNRDELKRLEIKKCGYRLFVVVDEYNHGHDDKFIEKEFIKLLAFIAEAKN